MGRPMIRATRRIQFCAGHRVVGHGGKCQNLHGHNYVALLTAEAEVLDGLGMVVDFGVLKSEIGGFIEAEWDHRLLLWDRDPWARILNGDLREDLGNAPVVVPFNPTAEGMAEFLLGIPWKLGDGVRLTSVRIWETENCYSEATE